MIPSNKKKIELRKFKKSYESGLSPKELSELFNITLDSVYKRIRKLRDENL